MSEDSDFRLAQYRAFSEARLHFSRLYFQTVAFILLAGLLAVVGLGDKVEPWRSWMMVAGGLALIQAGFISWRLRSTEVRYETLLRQLERDGDATTPASGRFGAKSLVTASLVLAGLILAMAGGSGLA